ncbi:MAG: S8 family serine peptidase [Oceanococcus sp.]
MLRISIAALSAALALTACQGGRDDLSNSATDLSLTARAGELCLAQGESITLAQWEGNAGLPTDSADQVIAVPAGCQYDTLTVKVEWALFLEDLDLEIINPEGNAEASSGAFNAQEVDASETAILASPVAGDYIARVNNFAGVLTAFTGTATVECTTPGGCFSVSDDGSDPDNNPLSPVAADTRVIVSVLDSGVNPYHDFYYAGSAIYPDSAPSSVTPAVLYELGVKPENILELTRSGNMQLDLEADAAIWDSVKRGETYWIKGTNVVVISFAGGEVPALKPAVEKSAHGVGTSAAVLAANPEAVILFVETQGALGSDVSHDYAFLHPAVDILTTSYGISIPNTGFPLPEWRTFHNSYPAVVELGKLHFSSGGNGPGLTPARAGAGPWWSIGVSGNEEGTSEGRAVLSGNFPDFLSDFTQDLPYCHDAQNCYSNVGGTSFSTPRAAGVASRVLLDARRAANHTGGIDLDAEQPIMVQRDELPITNWFLRRALEQAAYIPQISDYDPTEAVFDLVGVPIIPGAEWLQVGWGDLTASEDKGVVSAALAHLGFEGEARSKAQGFCEFQTENIQQRKWYWDNIAATLPDVLGGDAPPAALDNDPFIYCASSLPHHPASNDPGGQ